METEYLDGCITAARHVTRKMAAMEGKLVWLGGDITVGM